jgi:hypothetical protein
LFSEYILEQRSDQIREESGQGPEMKNMPEGQPNDLIGRKVLSD